jgi:hypothetical protein
MKLKNKCVTDGLGRREAENGKNKERVDGRRKTEYTTERSSQESVDQLELLVR